MDPWPVQAPASVDDLDMHGQIWRLGRRSSTWKRVFRSPDIKGRRRDARCRATWATAA